MSRRPGPRTASDYLDKTFGELKVLEYAGNSNWICSCTCGGFTKVTSYALRKGMQQSCGCQRKRALRSAVEARRELRELMVVFLRNRHLVAMPSAQASPELEHWMDRALACARALKEPV